MAILELAGLSLEALQATIVTAVIIAFCVSFLQLSHRAKLAKLPVIGEKSEKWRKHYLDTGRSIYVDGYKRFKSEIYRIITTDGNTNLVVPPQFLPELRKIPDDMLSFPKATDNTMEAKYTKILTGGPLASLAIHTIKADLTTALVRLNAVVCQEVDDATREEFGLSEEWEKHWIYMKLCNIVAKASGRVIVGPDHCHEKDFLDHSIHYTIDLMNARHAVKKTRHWLRPLLAPRLPEVKQLREREAKANKFLEPIVRARREALRDPNYEKPDDMLQWFMKRSDDSGVGTTKDLTTLVLTVLFAAIHTTTTTTTNILYTLAAFPEYIPELRQEIRSVMAENGGTITFRALQSMIKLDSFMKEAIRFHPIGLTAFSRKVLKGFKLSNGQYLPAGSFIEVASGAVYLDEAKYPNSDKFDGFRFAKARDGHTAAENSRNLFVASNEQDLNFGYGKHACPGRFFATNEIKMLLARIILEYDVKNEDGKTGLEGRIQNLDFGTGSNPDVTKPLLFRKAQV